MLEVNVVLKPGVWHEFPDAENSVICMDLPSLDFKRVFIAGPMTGLPDFNRPAFFAAAEYLEAKGCIVLNPAVLPDGLTHDGYLRITLAMLAEAQVVVFLPGWMESKGARMEFTRAHGHKQLVALDLGEVDGQPWVRGHRPLMV